MRKSKKLISILLTAALVISLVPAASAFQYTQMTEELSVEGYEITTVAPDTRHITLRASNSNGKQNINAVEFDPQNPYTVLRAGLSAGYVYSTQTVNTIANNMSDTDGGDTAVAAINADFFTFGVGVPHGVFIDEGKILSTPPQYSAAFGLTYDNEPFVVRHGTILDKIFRIDGVLVDVSGINMTHTSGADSLMLYTADYARGTKTGTETYELRCRVNSGEVRHGDTISFTVEEIHDAVGNTPLGDGYVVLSAQGARIDDLKKLNVGDTLEMTFRFNEFWSNVKFAVGGNELLLQNGEIYSTSDKSNQPRTSIGIRKDGTVVMATFDGRGAGNAVGMSYQTAAEAMRALGCVDALNLDGGGSTTFVLRTPGAMKTSVVNNVSGSSPRQVANAVVLMNTAPTLRTKNLVISSSRLVLAGGEYDLAVSAAYDDNYKPCPVPSLIEWETDSYLNEITDSDKFFARAAETTTINAYGGGASGSTSIEVVDNISEIITDKAEISAKAGETVRIVASAMLDGRAVESPQELFSWSAPESLGTFTEPGKLLLSQTAKEGIVTVSYGDVSATVKISPETPPVTVSDFETDDVSFIPVGISTNVAPNFKLETERNLVHFGERSLKVYYNFLNTQGSVGSYYMISPESPDTSSYTLSSVPKKLGMTVFGDGSGVELRSLVVDANGVQHSVSYGKIEHTGWKYMEANLPENLTGPIYIKVPVHLVSNPEKLTQGCMYFDRLRAVYSDIEEDLTSPVITKAWPSGDMIIYARNPSIGVILRDESATDKDAGIDADTVEIWVNGYNCTDREYNSETGKISYTVKNSLKTRKHTIIVRARDRAGNLMVREWKFEVR